MRVRLVIAVLGISIGLIARWLFPPAPETDSDAVDKPPAPSAKALP